MSSPEKFPIVIIGSGFGGIAMAIALKRAGDRDFVMLERAGEVGGVWRDNAYPGAACDVVSRIYSFSYDQDYAWSTEFAPQPEILAYVRGVVERHDLRRHIRFDTEVVAARFDGVAALWRLETALGGQIETPVLISAVGLFNRIKIPDFPGRETFKGAQFHSARWDHAFDLAGKTVAVIGNGASAVQFLPKIAPLVKQLYLSQRTPQYVLPRSIFPGTGAWDARLQRYRWLRGLARLKIFLAYETFVWRRKWRPQARLKGEAGFRAMLATKIADPVLRAKLTPDFPIGCKRQLVSNEWFETLIRPNVAVIDAPIAAITETGLKTADGTERDADAIIYGTGFTPTDYLQPMKITGLGGRELNQAWREGAEAYLGITVTGFPNFFMLYGPNTNAITSIIYMLECQARYIADCIRALRARRAAYMNVRAGRQARFIAEVQRRFGPTVQAMSL
ncbi:MAG TPA: NAD(P)/FAD-dependent oxidoreductase, partial [Stellaceae bacterium]|nr:NAD(P)/FAD-dependent oxidoreductase [Stellaceae bacterium]